MSAEKGPAYKGVPVSRKRLTAVPPEFRGTTKDGSITADTSPLKGKLEPKEVFHANKNPRGQA